VQVTYLEKEELVHAYDDDDDDDINIEESSRKIVSTNKKYVVT
jgi:hypothetical protein